MSEQSYTTTKSNHALAIVSLVLGVLGLIQMLPLVGPIGAVITGNIARREIRQNPDQYEGDNLAQAGVITGWIGIAISIILLTVICLGILFFIPVSSESFRY